NARHHLDTRRDDEVELARRNSRGGVEVRLHRRAALPVDRRRGDADGPACGQYRHASDVPALLADLRDAPHLNVVDRGWVDVTAPPKTTSPSSFCTTTA